MKKLSKLLNNKKIMKRKEVKILGLSYSQTQVGSYIVVLSEIKGNKKLLKISNKTATIT